MRAYRKEETHKKPDKDKKEVRTSKSVENPWGGDEGHPREVCETPLRARKQTHGPGGEKKKLLNCRKGRIRCHEARKIKNGARSPGHNEVFKSTKKFRTRKKNSENAQRKSSEQKETKDTENGTSLGQDFLR